MEPAKLIVSRTSDRDLKFRGIEVLVDGSYIGTLLFGDTLEIDIEPGQHVLKATNRLKSKSVEFDANPGESIKFQAVGIALGGLWIVMAMTGTVAYRIALERE